MSQYTYDPNAPTEIIEMGIPPEEGEEQEEEQEEDEEDYPTDRERI